MVKVFGGNGKPFISKKVKRFVGEKYSVCFKMILKDESSR